MTAAYRSTVTTSSVSSKRTGETSPAERSRSETTSTRAATVAISTTRRDVLHVHSRNPAATIVGDLADAPQIADGTFDCIVVTQTLHLIYDVDLAVATLHRILRPSGVVLATFPGISQLSGDEWSRTWSWGFDSRLARRLFATCFGEHNVTVEAHGNSLAAAAFLQGLATVDLNPAQLDADEAGCELLVAVRAVR